MATNYPGSLDTSTQQPSPSASTEMDDSGFEHDAVHTNHSGAIIALETKVGTGSSTAVADSVLAGTGSGTSGWSTAPSLAGLTVDTDTLHVDATNGRVGIGTTSPSQHLHVNSGNTNTTSVFESADGTAIIGIKDSASSSDIHVGVAAIGNDLRLRAGNAYRMHIDNDGNVGIATTSPAVPLHVVRSASSEVVRLQNNNSENQGPYISLYDLNSRVGYMGFPDNDDLHFKNETTSGRIYLSTNNSTRLTVHQDGSVGIGTTSPSYKLQVQGTGYFNDRVRIHGNGSGILALQDTGGTDTGGYIEFDASNGTRMGYMGFGNNDDIHIRNENSGGNIYIGVATRWAAQIDTSGNLLPYADNLHSLGASGRAWNHFYLHQANTFSSGGFWTLRSRDSDRQVMEYTSSERWKKDIVDLPLSEAYQILDARVIKYRGIDDDDDTPLEAGLSAESMHNAGYEYAVRYDEGHWGETPRSVYYDMLTAPLIKICKDLHDRVTALEAA